MRKLLLLGLCLAFALQGAVQASVVDRPCPMQKPGHARAAKTTHRCCNDAGTAAKTGKACKTGQACPAAGAWLASSQGLCTYAPVAVSRVSSPEPFALSIDFGGRWRPPALG
jgi:hypothetical protein